MSIGEIFLEFLMIGATSFGGVVPYLRAALVGKRRWIDDKEFVEMLSISQSLPGLNATNMAILVGEKLRGMMGSVVAILGICLPGGVLMYIVGIVYQQHGDHAWPQPRSRAWPPPPWGWFSPPWCNSARDRLRASSTSSSWR